MGHNKISVILGRSGFVVAEETGLHGGKYHWGRSCYWQALSVIMDVALSVPHNGRDIYCQSHWILHSAVSNNCSKIDNPNITYKTLIFGGQTSKTLE